MPVFDQKQLAKIVSTLDLQVGDQQLRQWQQHLELLLRWNKAYNLTAITKPNEVLTHHLCDSLVIAPYVTSGQIVDVGTGGGFPGIPMAVFYPEKNFVLVDTVLKKVRFLRQVVAELGLSNVEVRHARVEELSFSPAAGQVVSRAFSTINDFLSLTQKIADPDTQWLAMKGRYPEDELRALSNDFAYTSTPLQVPGLDAERHLIQIHRRNDE